MALGETGPSSTGRQAVTIKQLPFLSLSLSHTHTHTHTHTMPAFPLLLPLTGSKADRTQTTVAEIFHSFVKCVY